MFTPSFSVLSTGILRWLSLFPSHDRGGFPHSAVKVHSSNTIEGEPQGVHAIQALIKRRLPESYHDRFTLHISDDLGGKSNDAFSVIYDQSRSEDQITITASSTCGLSRGVLSFLRDQGADIAWSGDSFQYLPDPSDLRSSDLQGGSWAKWRYFLNVVSLSYTTVWYDFDKWEYLLDWASLHGFNMILALGGQEYIWAEVYKDFGMTENQTLGYFSGPAFQAWQRMGNIHGSWGQNVTREWVEKQWVLQKQLVARMVALGITPILPGFSGFVPQELHELIGGPEFIKASNWNGFSVENSDNHAIDPTWDTWTLVQEAFLKKQQELYGGWTSHYYSIDLYNELQPPSTDLSYLTTNTQSVIRSLRNVDPEAVWVMQGWFFNVDKGSWTEKTVKALLHGAEKDEILILDLTSEASPVWNETESYFDHDWLYCHLMNYGQEQGFYGELTHYVNEIIRSLHTSKSIKGMGLTMEGMSMRGSMNQNELVYELVTDTAWSDGVLNPVEWLKRFIRNRYALRTASSRHAVSLVQEAWRLIAATAYENRNPNLKAVNKAALELVPTPWIIESDLLTYNTSALVESLDLLITAANHDKRLLRVKTFHYDLVDVARQVFMNAGDKMYRTMIASWKHGNQKAEIESAGRSIVDLLKDVNRILGTDDHFLLSSWIADARSWSDDSATQDFYEFQCRNQISIWGTQNVIPWPLDRYASKSWHGVLDPFYADNWEAFYAYLIRHPPEAYNHTDWLVQLSHIEQRWNQLVDGGNRPTVISTSALELIKLARVKWAKWV
ncbi:tim-barrel domain-domain-containing protein [Kockovaella imperatae]|uniref:Tim-barrel domain-domain-containing protein n=1 Tax=Kockovaella imperatae TaxID=4999 RepID=A0A1Y1U9Q4_9TREE|nr:tim-barrel domain-domain-containing protein [Kockovaella imperatae]ORX34236.1 tim-barrel domain-domain-containing protein [Kockovaella imperatae]